MDLSTQQQIFLQSMGIAVWRERGFEETTTPVVVKTEPLPALEQSPASADWIALRNDVPHIAECICYQKNTGQAANVMQAQTNWMIVNEVSNEEAHKQAGPFIGRAGQLFKNMLQAMSLADDHLVITNLLKPESSESEIDDSARYADHLAQQIASIQPKLILALGRFTAQTLLKIDTPLGKMREQKYHYGETDIPVIVTYHPAYLLRSPKEKQKSWQDLLRLKASFEKPS